MEKIKNLKNQVIVSVQASHAEPLYEETAMKALMQSVLIGNPGGLRVAGYRDVKMAKALTDIPIIGITKPDIIPTNFEDLIYITPTIKDVQLLIKANADIIAFDATLRNRDKENSLENIIKTIKTSNKLAMADISTFEEGFNAYNLGVDIISTTLSGYTSYSKKGLKSPDFELLKQLVKNTTCPIILEGRIWDLKDIKRAFEFGAYAVVIGSAITRPQLITKRFVAWRENL